jgi:hypothetical protein
MMGFAVHETANHARQISKVIGQNSNLIVRPQGQFY